jgi:predicted XRE-type DNA-binding protein
MKKGAKIDPIEVQQSSGNVFEDLLVNDAPDMLAKAELVHRICELIEERGLTQKEAAEILGLDQPKVSALIHGKLAGFSTDRLLRFLNDLGQEVEIVLRPTQPAGRRGSIHVIARAM